MKRKISRALPGDSKNEVVVPFPQPKATRTTVDDSSPGQMFMFRLRNGFIGHVSVPDKEADRLWRAVQEPDGFHCVIVFDSFKRRIALNLRYVVASQFDSFGDSGLLGGFQFG